MKPVEAPAPAPETGEEPVDLAEGPTPDFGMGPVMAPAATPTPAPTPSEVPVAPSGAAAFSPSVLLGLLALVGAAVALA